MADIVVVGGLNMDLVIKVARMPLPGETLAGHDFQAIPGGKGANQAAAAARLGPHVAMVGRVGDDAYGPQLVENLSRQGVDTTHIQVDGGAATGLALILVDQAGQNSIVTSAGANGRVGFGDVDRIEAVLSEAQLLLLQFEVPMEAVRHVIELAAGLPVKVVLNPAPAWPVSPESLAKVDYLVPNETEATALTGVEVEDTATAEAAARELLGYGVGAAIITLGAQGALLATREGSLHVPAAEVPAVDTTAAGDAFIGGLATALVRGFSLQEAVRYATCAGTLAVTAFGAQTSLPDKAQVQAFYESGAL